MIDDMGNIAEMSGEVGQIVDDMDEINDEYVEDMIKSMTNKSESVI